MELSGFLVVMFLLNCSSSECTRARVLTGLIPVVDRSSELSPLSSWSTKIT